MLKMYSSEGNFSIKIIDLQIACIFAGSSLDCDLLFINVLVSYHYIEISYDALELLQPSSCLEGPKLVLFSSHQFPEGNLIFMHLLGHYTHKHTSQQNKYVQPR